VATIFVGISRFGLGGDFFQCNIAKATRISGRGTTDAKGAAHDPSDFPIFISGADSDSPISIEKGFGSRSVHHFEIASMLRISVLTHGDRSATLRLEGHISGAWIGELGDICDRLLGEKRALTLDLADVSMIERAGLRLLAVLVGRGVNLTGCSPFRQAQLQQAASVCESTPPNP